MLPRIAGIDWYVNDFSIIFYCTHQLSVIIDTIVPQHARVVRIMFLMRCAQFTNTAFIYVHNRYSKWRLELYFSIEHFQTWLQTHESSITKYYIK